MPLQCMLCQGWSCEPSDWWRARPSSFGAVPCVFMCPIHAFPSDSTRTPLPRDDVGSDGVLERRLLVPEVGPHEDQGDGDAEPEEDEQEEGPHGQGERRAL